MWCESPSWQEGKTQKKNRLAYLYGYTYPFFQDIALQSLFPHFAIKSLVLGEYNRARNLAILNSSETFGNYRSVDLQLTDLGTVRMRLFLQAGGLEEYVQTLIILLNSDYSI